MLEQIKAQWRFLVVGIALIAFAAAALAAGVAVLAQGQDDPASRQPVAAQGAAANVEAPVAVPAAADSTGGTAASGRSRHQDRRRARLITPLPQARRWARSPRPTASRPVRLRLRTACPILT